MPLIQKEETLVLSTKIPRKLHDEIDDVKKLAQESGFVYDPAEAIINALEKDIRTVKKELKKPAGGAPAGEKPAA